MEELEKDDEHFLRIQEERPCQQPFGNIANKIKKAAHQLTEKDKSLNRHHKRGNQSFEKLKKQSSQRHQRVGSNQHLSFHKNQPQLMKLT